MTSFSPTRRDFLQISSLAFARLAMPGAAGARRQSALRFGIVTDPHYADVAPRGTRFYGESAHKMRECVEVMNHERVDFLIELGDLKDQDEPGVEANTLGYLDTIEAELQRFDGPVYHVLGNHDMDSISKSQFLAGIDNAGIDPAASYYSFDRNGLHFVVLDANFRADGEAYDHGDFDYRDTNVLPAQLDWLARDLSSTDAPSILFVHQRLDGEGDLFVNNADEVRLLLRRRGNVVAVFHGHDHAGAYNLIDDIHYYTLRAVVEGPGPENSSFAIVDVDTAGLAINGYRRAVSHSLLET
jgi:predicted phosphodiesterase